MRSIAALLGLTVTVVLCSGLGAAKAKPQVISRVQTLQQNGNDNKVGVVLVSEQKQIWISCRPAKPDQFLPEGFCDRLIADFVQATGQRVGNRFATPEGETAVIVEVDQSNTQAAGVTLLLGRAENGAFVESLRQEMRLLATDAPLRAGSARALVYPIVSLLKLAP